MKIVVNGRFLCQPLTGIQRFAIEISLSLKEIFKGDIVFVAPSDIMQKDIAEKLNAKIIGKRHGQVWEQLDLLKYLNQNGRPLLLCLSGGAPVFYKNIVFTLHDIVYIRYPQSYSLAYRLFYRMLIGPVLRRAKAVVTVSEFSKSEIIDYYKIPKEKIAVVYNAVSDVFTNRASVESGRQNNRTGNLRYFLAVSSPAYHKNFAFLVESFLQTKLPENVHLNIVGKLDGSLYRSGQLTEQVQDNPRIHFLGRVSDEELVDWYSNAIAFVFPSLYEGFGIPPLEAQACDCLVLTSDQASLPEVLKDSALYFSPEQTESLSERFRFVLVPENKDIFIHLKQKGIANLKRFGWEKSAHKMADLLNSFV